MNQNHIRTLDLNLLKVFEALLDEGGVTPAGRRLGLTQSAVSHALNRLRHRVGDPLFVRTPQGMRPTPRALEIGAQVREALAQLQAALEPARFDPTATTRRFTLAATSYVGSVLLPGLMAALETEAPDAEIRVVSLGAGAVEGLDQGRIDLAIGGFGKTPDRYVRQRLFEDPLVWVMREGHPLASKPLTLEGLAACPHLVVGTGEEPETGEALIDHGLERRVMLSGGEAFHAALAAEGLRRRVRLTAASGEMALTVIASTDLIALLPRRLVPPGAPFHAVAPPHPAPALEMAMVWRKAQDSPARAWLRGELLRIAEGLAAAEFA